MHDRGIFSAPCASNALYTHCTVKPVHTDHAPIENRVLVVFLDRWSLCVYMTAIAIVRFSGSQASLQWPLIIIIIIIIFSSLNWVGH